MVFVSFVNETPKCYWTDVKIFTGTVSRIDSIDGLEKEKKNLCWDSRSVDDLFIVCICLLPVCLIYLHTPTLTLWAYLLLSFTLLHVNITRTSNMTHYLQNILSVWAVHGPHFLDDPLEHTILGSGVIPWLLDAALFFSGTVWSSVLASVTVTWRGSMAAVNNVEHTVTPDSSECLLGIYNVCIVP